MARPLWRKGPLALRHFPSAAAAVMAGSLLATIVVATFPVMLSATASRLLGREIANSTVSRYGAGLLYSLIEIRYSKRAPGSDQLLYEQRGEMFARLAARSPLLGPPVSSILGPVVRVRSPLGINHGRLVTSEDQLDHVRRLAGKAGPGVWLPQVIADSDQVHPGDRVWLDLFHHTVRVRVAGVYATLSQELPRGYWRHWHDEIFQTGPAADHPPPQFILASQHLLIRLSQRLGDPWGDFDWQAPLAPGVHPTLDQARQLARWADRLQSRSAAELRQCHCRYESAIGFVVADVSKRMAIIGSPARVLLVAGVVVALAVMSGAGLFVVARRRVEYRLLHARGWSPVAVGARAFLETLVPAAVGAALGLGLALSVSRGLNAGYPAAPNATLAGVLVTLAIWLLGAALTGAVAAISFTRTGESDRGGWVRVAGPVVGVAGAAAALFLLRDLRAGGALVTNPAGIPQPRIQVVLFPPALILAFAGIGAWFVVRVLRMVRRRSRWVAAPGPLALRRLTYRSAITTALVAGSAVCLGLFLQGRSVVDSLHRTVDAKARIFVGGDVAADVDFDTTPSSRFPYPWTRVTHLTSAGTLGTTGSSYDLLAVDPSTLARVAYWDPSFGAPSLTSLTDQLLSGNRSTVPVVLANGTAPRDLVLTLAGRSVPATVVGEVRAFPGMISNRPLVVVDEQTIARIFGLSNPLAANPAVTQLWIRGDAPGISAALDREGITPFVSETVDEVKDVPGIAAVIDTFTVMNVLAIAAGILLVVVLLMYLQARQRTQSVAYILLDRMGLPLRRYRRSLAIEIGAMMVAATALAAGLAYAAARSVVPLLDPLATIPPHPLFAEPVLALAAAVASLGVVTLGAAWLTAVRAKRTNPVEVLRIAE